MIHARIARLNRPALSLLGAAAVIQRNCTFARLCQIADANESDGLNALDDLLASRLLLEEIDAPRPYLIAHERIRQVVDGELGSARQKIFYRRELDALTAEHAPAAEMAFHAFAAGEWQAAFQNSMSAGEAAMKLYAVSSGIYHYESARRLLNEQRANADSATCVRLYLNLGKAFEIDFQQLNALAVYQELQSLAETRGDDAMKLAALVASGTVRAMPFDAHDSSQAALLAEQALPLARALGDLRAEAQVEHNLALVQIVGSGNIERALPHVENSARLARLAGGGEPLGMSLLDLATLSLSLGRIEQADAACFEAAEIFQRAANHPRLQDAVHLRAMLKLGVGEFETALALLAQAYAANQALGNPTETFALATTRSTLHILRGEYARALQEFASLQTMDENRITSTIRMNVRQQLAWLYLDAGDYDAALEQCRRAQNCSDEGQPALQVPTLTLLTLIHIARGEWENAANVAARANELFERDGKLYPEWWEALPFPLAQGELALARGDLPQAISCAEYLTEKFTMLRLRHHLTGVFFFHARVALAQGDKQAAMEHLRAAIELANEIGARREVWGMCSSLAQLERAQGNVEAADRLMNCARDAITFVSEHLGAPELRATFLARADVKCILQ